MAKRKWTNEEIEVYRKEHSSFAYYNTEDANLFVPKVFGFGIGLNWGNPISWVIFAVLLGLVLWSIIFH